MSTGVRILRGMGLSTAHATEAIMGVVPKRKASIGSAANGATHELGASSESPSSTAVT